MIKVRGKNLLHVHDLVTLFFLGPKYLSGIPIDRLGTAAGVGLNLHPRSLRCLSLCLGFSERFFCLFLFVAIRATITAPLDGLAGQLTYDIQVVFLVLLI